MTRYDNATLQRLSFRRQFILGPRFLEGFPAWQRTILEGGLRLTVHSDLEVCHVTGANRAITVLGYMLDPSRPSASNLDIATDLLAKLPAGGDVFEHTARFGGRWVLIVNNGVRTIVFTDAAGLREVAYTAGSAPGALWCASQPGLLAEVVDRPLDRDAVTFLQTGRMLWLPGDATPYQGMKLLLPNHYLDLGTGRPSRYWPTTDLPTRPFLEAVRTSAEIIRGLMEGVEHRGDLMLALTAGWDSRLTLAASRPLTREMFHFTAVFTNTAVGDPDVTAPARLLRKLGRKHAILDCVLDVDEEFAKIYRRNVTMAHEEYGPVAQALLDQTPSESVCVRGDVAEIAKCYYRLDASHGGEVTAHDLCELIGLPAHPFVIREFEGWLAGARGRSHNIPLLDLFYWEQEAARLHSVIEAECDIARESFALLNCRSLLTTMLSVPEPYRQEPAFDFFRALIKRLWPEALTVPINERPQTGPGVAIRRTIARLGLLDFVPRPVKQTAKFLISFLFTDL